nr:MAG: replication initiator protein [Microvirus sp.]
MACLHPMPAWRTAGGVSLREPVDAEKITGGLRLPCGRCLGCRMDKARDWAVRCQLELKEHTEYCWTTLTYSDDHLPLTLRKDHLSAWLKRLRARHPSRTIRFFASGEYGERTHRPHYHSILFGLPDDPSIQETWPFGMVRVDPISPAAIAYVAGYTSKKVGWREEPRERVDPETGECYEWQPPFLQMSRRPGIGGAAREHWKSWRQSCYWHGRQVPVPRFLHEAYKLHASPLQLQQLQEEKDAKSQQVPVGFHLDYNATQLHAKAVHALRKHQHQSEKRTQL